MKTIGLIGGMSWESTSSYYKVINETIKELMGGLHSAQILMYSVDFEVIEKNQSNGNWDENARILSDVAKRLEGAGADFILICTNTMHKVFDEIQNAVSVPILHIAQTTADAIQEESLNKVGLLGTKYTLQETFYVDKLNENGIDVLIPNTEDILSINRIIFEELCLGVIKKESKDEFIRIIKTLIDDGAQGIILGCTEIGLLIKPEDVSVSTFDTALIHAIVSANLALQ